VNATGGEVTIYIVPFKGSQKVYKSDGTTTVDKNGIWSYSSETKESVVPDMINIMSTPIILDFEEETVVGSPVPAT
jgi:hypothetical protein